MDTCQNLYRLGSCVLAPRLIYSEKCKTTLTVYFIYWNVTPCAQL